MIATDIVDGDAIAIGEIYGRIRLSFIESVEAQIECGHRLAEKKAKLAHGMWQRWFDANADALGFGERTARMLMKAAAVAKRKPASVLDMSDAFKISRQMWGHKGAGNHLAQGTGENEWYTPPEFIALAREVMGEIDLDPASSAEANETVGAAEFYTAEDDGLDQQWYGRVWLNPPYSRELMPKFMDKLKAGYKSGNIDAAIVVTHNNTDTGWFHSLADIVSAICFASKRIKFYRGDTVAAPVNGQIFLYFGADVPAFTAAFTPVGFVMVPA